MAADDRVPPRDDHTRLAEIMDVVVAIASNDFTRRARIGDGSHLLDGLAAGVNMLSEEVEAQYERERDLHQRMVRSERLAAIGQLAAGVAHEINNPAAFVLANLMALEQMLATHRAMDAPETQALLAQIREMTHANLSGVEQIANIVGDLRNFARLDAQEFTSVPVDAIFDDACRLVRAELAYRARLVLHRAPGLRVHGSHAKLTQVLTNLLVNAAQAIPEGDPDRNEVTVSAGLFEREVVITVKDTGCGIAPDVQARLFEPFFTTKSKDQGTGLGLAISADIARQHGGSLTLEQSSSAGSVFALTLRHVSEPPALALAAPPAVTTAPRARVLLIDDEPLLLRSLCRLFDAEFDVVTAEGGEAAVQVLALDDDWDTVICDLMMPDLDGAAVFEWVRQHRPGLADRMFFASGGAFTPRGFAFADLIGDRLLQKPIRPDVLRAAVARVRRQPAAGV